MPQPEPQAGSSLPVSRCPVPTSPRIYTPGTPLDSLLAPPGRWSWEQWVGPTHRGRSPAGSLGGSLCQPALSGVRDPGTAVTPWPESPKDRDTPVGSVRDQGASPGLGSQSQR